MLASQYNPSECLDHLGLEINISVDIAGRVNYAKKNSNVFHILCKLTAWYLSPGRPRLLRPQQITKIRTGIM